MTFSFSQNSPRSRFFKALTLIALSLSLTHCSLLPKSAPKEAGGPKSKVFFASYEQVWRAAQLALASYPMRVNNMDTGLLETDLIGGSDAWTPPGKKERIPNAQNYIIRIQVIRGRSRRSKAVKVIVEKVIRIKSNFFSDARSIASNGLEEKVILYRTRRILTIERAIESALSEEDENEES